MISISVLWRMAGLCALPILYFVLVGNYINARGPLYLTFNNDPSYVYLTNSMLVSEGIQPMHTDHPGTPLQIFGAGYLRLMHAGSTTDAMLSAALSEPEKHLSGMMACLKTAAALALLFSAIIVYQASGSYLAGLGSQAAPLLMPECVQAFRHFAPEPLLVCLVVLFISLVLVRGFLHLHSKDETANRLEWSWVLLPVSWLHRKSPTRRW